MSIVFTDEQQAIFDFVKNNPEGNCWIHAVAGGSKSTVLVEAAKLTPDESILIAAFNKLIKVDIEKKVEEAGLANVEVLTLNQIGHRLLWSIYGKSGYNDKKENELAKLGADFLRKENRLKQSQVNLAYELSRDCLNYIYYNAVSLASYKDKVSAVGYSYPKLAKTLEKDVLESLMHFLVTAIFEASKTKSFCYSDQTYLPAINFFKPKQYNKIFIDEQQDLNVSQTLMLKKLAKPKQMVVVGDVNQLIYEFRGANYNLFNSLEKFMGRKFEIFKLTKSFRCCNQVIDYVNNTFDLSDKFTSNGTDGEVNVLDIDDYDDIDWTEINRINPASVILARKNEEAMTLALSLLMRDCTVYMQLAKLFEYKLMSTNAIAKTPDFDAFMDRLNNINMLFEDFCKAVSNKKATYKIYTIHSIKGLEWENVILLKSSKATVYDNLYYVGATRAKKNLLILNIEGMS